MLSNNDNNNSNNNNFIIILLPSSVPCGTSGVTCSKAVTVKVGTGPHQERIKMRKGREVERTA